MTITGLRRLALAALAFAAAGALAGCNENERDRVLHFEKGTYKGAADTPLSDDARAALRDRAAAQRY
ncbi:hypothetical protein [Azospirillum halopraeferens]|uniref:hypothetical protein n=1 Tax=Azospirillum halopraeferens TaxID=34010 RepID=UPI00041BC2CB|nr:hypothetical protein [Azospirillum halopraeferens]